MNSLKPLACALPDLLDHRISESETTASSEDNYIATNTAEQEYIEIAKQYYESCDQEGGPQQQQTFLHLVTEEEDLDASIQRPHLEKSYEETLMQNTRNEPEARSHNIPEEPKSNTEQPMTCIFERNHKDISLDKYGRHLKKCKARVIMKQSMLKPDDERKVGAKTRRVRGESYRQGTVLISSKHKELPEMEQCHYDPRHHIVNSKTKYHCGDCCARISKGSNNDENSGDDPEP